MTNGNDRPAITAPPTPPALEAASEQVHLTSGVNPPPEVASGATPARPDQPTPSHPTPSSPTPSSPTPSSPTPASPAPSHPTPARPTPACVRPSTPGPTAPVPARPATDPTRWGRIDADGTAHLNTPEGDVVIGQWAAGTVEEGMAFFGRKFDDLMVEADLARTRLLDGRATPDQTVTAVEHLRSALATPLFMGDIAQLRSTCDELDALIAAQREVTAQRKREAREAARQAREAIVAEAESLATSTRWKATGDRFAALLEDWKTAPRVDRGTEQQLWKRFSAARATFDRTRRAHFAEREGARKEAVAAKEKLIKEAEALSGSTDWAGTTREYRRLMDLWKAAGHAGKGAEDRLWERFRAAQDVFFAARDAANADRDAEQKQNLQAKAALAAEAEALLPITDINAAKKELRRIGERWEAIGHVPRNDKDRVEGRLRKVEQAIRSMEQDAWKRSNPETRARASDTAVKFAEAVAKAERERDEALARGDAAAAAKADEKVTSTRALLSAVEGALSEFSR